MLTAFGIENALAPESEYSSPFYRMPPVSFRLVRDFFMPDYELLLLCDKLVMDEASFDRLTASPSSAFSKVADTFFELYKEDRIELVDFGRLLKKNDDLLERMIERDLSVLDQWVVPLRESLAMWRHFSYRSKKLLAVHEPHWYGPMGPHFHEVTSLRTTQQSAEVVTRDMVRVVQSEAHVSANFSETVEEALRSATKRRKREYREALQQLLRSYLLYVNANLVLSNELGVGFHDWFDFTPFYATKFLAVGKEKDQIRDSRAEVERLFSIPFPELAITNTRGLMKALNDNRIADLRQLIDDAVSGKVKFDQEFAKATLKEVLSAEDRSRRWRSILGFLTMPLGMIPWIGTVADKAASEVLGAVADAKARAKRRWFYMLSEIAEPTEERNERGADTR